MASFFRPLFRPLFRRLARRLGAARDGDARQPASPGSGGDAPRVARPGLELRVREGADAERTLRVETDEVVLGRASGDAPEAGTLALRDRTVSVRQAVLRREGGRFVIEHVATATNPTLLNDEPVSRARLRSGDRIRVGAVLLDVSLPDDGDDTDVGPARGDADRTISWGPPRRRDDTTEIRSVAPAATGHLQLLAGLPAASLQRYPLREGENRIGRAPDCEVPLADPGISRLHAVIVCREGRVELLHRSRTNTTEVNGEAVSGRRRLYPGDEIALSDRVVLRVELPARRGAPPRRTLLDVMEERTHIDRALAEFEREGSFVDVDVVDSYGMKAGAPHASVVVSFERLRAWLRDVAAEHDGQFLNSNGDESMFFFTSADGAVDAGVAILERLGDFNRDRNELESPFRLRIGIHSGRAAVDLQRGYAYSAVLDAAGHIQKAAVGGGLMVSGETRAALSRTRPFEPHGELQRHGIDLYRYAP